MLTFSQRCAACERYLVTGFYMFDYRQSDQERYGVQVYHHHRKQGNHRWDTAVHKDESGQFTAVFRHSFSKKQPDGVKRTMIRDEVIVRAKSAGELIYAEFPAYPDTEILKESDFFKGLELCRM